MSNPWEMDWEEEASKVDEEASARGRLPEGYYRCKLVETKLNNEDASQKFKFVVTHGEHAKRVHFETLRNPKFTETDDQKKAAVSKAQIFAVRMGAVPRETKGKAAPNWILAVGKEFVLKITERKYKPTTGKHAGVEQTSADCGFSGIWGLDHDDIGKLKNDVRASLGLPAIAGNDPKPGAAAGTTAPANGNGNPTTVPASPPPSKMAMDIFS